MSRPMDLPDWHLVIQPKDTIGDKFKRCAINAAYEGRTLASRDVAIWLHLRMDWPSGKVNSRTSVRELAKSTRLSTRSVQDALDILMRAKLIRRTYMGKGKRATIEASAEVAALEPGIYVYDLWADEGKTVAISTTLRPEMGCSSIHHTSVAESATECGGIYYDNPIFPSSPDPLASRQAEIEEAKASTTERPLTTPHTSMPETNLNKRGFARARVADATRDFRVADGTNLDLGVGYGFDIIGLERGEATRLIADLTKLDPSNTINPGGVWDSLKKWVVKFGPERVRGAIVDMQLKQRSGKLDIPAMRALPSFAGAFQSAQAASERIAAVSAPDGAVRRVSRLDMFGLRK